MRKQSIFSPAGLVLGALMISQLSLPGQVTVAYTSEAIVNATTSFGSVAVSQGDLAVVAISAARRPELATYALSASDTGLFGEFFALSSDAGVNTGSWILWGTVTGTGTTELLVYGTGLVDGNAALSVLRPAEGQSLSILTDAFTVSGITGGSASADLTFTLPEDAMAGSSNYAITALTNDIQLTLDPDPTVDSLTQAPVMTERTSDATNLKRYVSDSNAITIVPSSVFTIANSISVTGDPNFNFTGAGALVYATGTAGPPVDPEELNILFIGNSFTFRHDLPLLVKQVFQEGQPNLIVNAEWITYGGQDMFRHHDIYFSETMVRLHNITVPEIEEKIAIMEDTLAAGTPPDFYTAYWEKTGLDPVDWNVVEGVLDAEALPKQRRLIDRINSDGRVKWDYLVLQSWKDIVDDVDAGYAEYAWKWAQLAQQEGIKVILYITAKHAQNAYPVTEPLEPAQTEMELNTVQQLVQRIQPHAVVPVGLALKNIQQNGTDLVFRYVNDMHPNQYTAFLTANMFYAAFFKQSTEGFDFDTVVETKLDADGKDPDGGDPLVVFTEPTKSLLQRAAYEAVMEFDAGYPDSDHDGLLESTEISIGTSPSDPDSDDDGYSDGYEVSRGNNPLSEEDAPFPLSEIASVQPSSPDGAAILEFRFTAQFGQSFQVKHSTNLSDWSVVQSGISGNGGMISRIYSISTSESHFYMAEPAPATP